MEAIAHHIQSFVASAGYPGLFLMVLIESTVVPVPSELVLPFAGNLAATGEMSLPLVFLMNSLGALVGSGLSYWFGAAGGKPLLLRYGKYLMVRPADIARTEAFFSRHGKATVLIARFVPVVRHIISIPAGVARMPLGAFFLQTFIGSTLWGGTLIIIGYELDWEPIAAKLKHVDTLIGAAIILLMLAVVVRFVLRRRRERTVGGDAT
jgi:membrane protein DedA with SNARE-associated domain